MISTLLLQVLLAAAAEPLSAEVFVQDDTEAQAAPDSEGPAVMPLGQTPPEVLQTAREVRNAPLPERMKAISEHLLGKPYVTDPLGEGQGLDADPYARYDAFDCLTFVEEVVALSLAGDPAHAAPIRQGLRYDGDPRAYPDRRHFMELQWIPGVVAAGWLRDTTADYAPVEHYERQVGAALWANWGRRSLFPLQDDELPLGTMQIDYIPLDRAAEVVPNIRSGSIVMAVREDRPWVPLWVTHLGFTVPSERPTLRHASGQQSNRKTRDHDLLRYLAYLGTYKNWKTAGIAIFEPVEFGPRMARVPASYAGPRSLVLRD